jgi:hypothetical protein
MEPPAVYAQRWDRSLAPMGWPTLCFRADRIGAVVLAMVQAR